MSCELLLTCPMEPQEGTFPADIKAGKAEKDGQALSAVPSSEAVAQPAPAFAGKGSRVHGASAPTALQVSRSPAAAQVVH